MRSTSFVPVSLLLLVPPAVGQATPDSASLVTRLGADTLVVERFVRSANRIEAEVVLRVPRTTHTRYVLVLSPAGELARLEALTTEPGGAQPVRREVVTRVADSLRIEVVDTGAPRVRMVAADRRVLPFIDMVHWPFELALMRLRASGAPRTQQPLLAGSRIADFELVAFGPDSMTITHPTRGTMRVRVDAAGRLGALDAGTTTRKLIVERRPWMSLDALAARWKAADSAGASIGALSGRAAVTSTVAGATITIDHGTPSKRGREIWGVLVPFGQVWRTGANQATQFITDRDLVFGTGTGALAVPAGAYTLFSIPERAGGLLIINRQTGQAGTAYDAARDLGRVPLEARPLPEAVEVFSIAVTADGDGGALRLQWDRTELVARFTVATQGE